MKPAQIFARAVALVTGKGSSDRTDVEAALRECEARSAAAAAELERLRARRPELLVHGSDADVQTHDAAVARTALERDRAVEIATKLRERLSAIVAAEAVAEREQRRADVELQCELATEALRERYPKLVAEARALLRTLAKAQSDIAGFAAAYPGEPPIADPETVARTPAPVRDEIVSERREWRWAHLDGKTIPDSLFHQVRLRLSAEQKAEIEAAKREAYRATGSAQLPRPLHQTGVTPGMLDEVKAGRGAGYVFETPYGDQVAYIAMMRREVRRSQPGPSPLPLASKIALPALCLDGDHDAWSPAGADVLAALDKPRGRPSKALVVEYVALAR